MPECQLRSLPIATLMEHPKEIKCAAESTIEIAADTDSPSSLSTINANDKIFSLTKTKDVDQLSVASSTHFTIVNGFGTPRRFKDTSLCRRSRQITILIVTMTILFMIAISVTIFLMESEYLTLSASKPLLLIVVLFQCVLEKCHVIISEYFSIISFFSCDVISLSYLILM
jgi:hypothetical protein